MPLFADMAIWIAAGAAVLALAAAVLAVRVARALEDAREEGRRTRKLAEVTSTLDLDVLLERTLATACALPGVESAAIALPEQPGGPLVVASKPAAPEGAAGSTVPLLDEDGKEIGTLTAFPPGESQRTALDELAGAAGTRAREGAALSRGAPPGRPRRPHRPPQSALLPRGLVPVRECARARRYERRLALVVVDIDDFKSVNDRIGHLAGDDILAAVAERLRSVVRGADVACRIGGDEFAVILPEAALPDAERLYGRIEAAASSDLTAAGVRLHISAGVAELGQRDDAVSLFQRADEALYVLEVGRQGAGSGGRTMVAENGVFRVGQFLPTRLWKVWKT